MNRQIHIYLPNELAIRLKIRAVQQGKSASAIAAEAIEEYLAFSEPPEPTPPVVSSVNGKKKGVAA